MTKQQKVKHFKGKNAASKVNKFIVKPNIKAINISMTDRDILLLYEEIWQDGIS